LSSVSLCKIPLSGIFEGFVTIKPGIFFFEVFWEKLQKYSKMIKSSKIATDFVEKT